MTMRMIIPGTEHAFAIHACASQEHEFNSLILVIHIKIDQSKHRNVAMCSVVVGNFQFHLTLDSPLFTLLPW